MKVSIFHFVSALCLISYAQEPAYAKETLNIMGVNLGDSVERLNEVFPEIIITEHRNKAHCKDEDVPIDNGTLFNADKTAAHQKYSFKLILIDGIQTVVTGVYSYTSTTLNAEIFAEKLSEKYDFDVVTEENLLTIKNSMPDYKGISHFVSPKGHYFKILGDDVLRLKYTSAHGKSPNEDEITHTIIIESKKLRSRDEEQAVLGEEERKITQDACAREEMKELAF